MGEIVVVSPAALLVLEDRLGNLGQGVLIASKRLLHNSDPPSLRRELLVMIHRAAGDICVLHDSLQPCAACVGCPHHGDHGKGP